MFRNQRSEQNRVSFLPFKHVWCYPALVKSEFICMSLAWRWNGEFVSIMSLVHSWAFPLFIQVKNNPRLGCLHGWLPCHVRSEEMVGWGTSLAGLDKPLHLLVQISLRMMKLGFYLVFIYKTEKPGNHLIRMFLSFYSDHMSYFILLSH